MEAVQQFIKGFTDQFGTNKNYYIWVILVVVIGAGVIIGNVVRLKKVKAAGSAFLAEHPDAAKVWLSSKSAVTQSVVQAISVNGEGVVAFNKGSRTGIYLLPGESTLALRYTYTRPGVMYKTVTKTWDGTVTVTCEANKSYLISFDSKAETFGIAETEEK